ncbi:DUF1549 domain-containing protein [Prosthecobacter sp.]|uniref:DUF1549 domain-containing protein n=1 Tax=Prosthecobacter sp. TaxID=1965333 RepID=UPI0037835CED
MKHRLLTMLLCCACLGRTDTQAATPRPDPVQEAATRIDAALMRDYASSQQRLFQRNNRPLPPLPPPVDDASFLRRACIDLAGRLPTPEEVRRFLASSQPEKRARLADALVKDTGAAEARFRMLAEAYRVKDDVAVIAWLRQAATDDRPYDQIVNYLVGEGHISRRDEGNPLRTGTEVAFAVLGADLHCALCHDHPYNSHTEMEAYQFAACFTMNDDFSHLDLPKDYLYQDGKPAERVKPRVLRLTREVPPYMKRGKDSKPVVAQWMTKDNPERFAAVAGLRVWSQLFGMPSRYVDRTIGGVDPAPSWHEVHAKPFANEVSSNCFTTPNRDLITWIDQDFFKDPEATAVKVLAEEFRRCGHRIGEFQRILARTNAYQRSGIDLNHAWSGGYLTPAPQIRRLPSEVIWDVFAIEKSAQLPQVPPFEHPLRMLGRGTREWSDESTTPVSHELVRFMMNSPEMESAAAAQAAGSSAEDLFVSILGRYPDGIEKAIAIQHQNEAPQTAARDIAWALLNTREFMFRP